VFLPFSKRGKEWEPKAVALRKLAGVSPTKLLDPWQLAPRVGLKVAGAEEFMKILEQGDWLHLRGPGRYRWSGGVFPNPLPDGMFLCFLNPWHSQRRNKVTLMEEICHIYLRHKPAKLVFSADGLSVRDYDKTQEEEAYGIGAAALLPWATFFPKLNSGCDTEELAEHYDVTTDLVGYRIKITGAYHLYLARQRG